MKNDHIKLYLMSAITMGAIFVAIAGTAFSEPLTDPPTGNVTPTFSGLNVEGDFDLKGAIANDGVTWEQFGGVWVPVPNIVSILDHVSVTGNLNVVGDITTSGGTTNNIGRFYIRNASINIPTSGLGDEIVSVTCDSGDYVTGCSSSFVADNYRDIHWGEIQGLNFCTAQAKNLGGTGDNSLIVYATCFSSDG